MENKPKNPKKVEQGKKLAALNRERREEWKKMKEELGKCEKQEEEEGLTIFKEEEVKKEHTTFIILPILTLTVVGAGVFLYLRKSEGPEVPKEDSRPRIIHRLERL